MSRHIGGKMKLQAKVNISYGMKATRETQEHLRTAVS